MASTSKSTCTSGRPLRGQAREVIFNVYTHLKDQKEQFKLKYNVLEATSNATGVSESLVKKIAAEGKQSLVKGRLNFSTPQGKKSPRAKKIIVDDFTQCVIRRKIHDFYAVKKIPPTLAKLKTVLEEENVLKCGREYLRKLITKMGFKWMKTQTKRKLIMEQPHIASWRINYLREIRKLRNNNKNIVYVDETYVNKSHTTPMCWQSKEEIGFTKDIGKGPRLIIIHAGGEAGFVPNALQIWDSRKKPTKKTPNLTDDYHDDMDYNNFSKWVSECLLPNLPNNSVIVLDNASYHNKQEDKKPNSSFLKADIQQWLTRHNIAFTPAMTKPELLMCVKSANVQQTYSVDKIITNAGHTVIRLPPYHADLNPIELVWGDIKGRVAEAKSESLKEKQELCYKLFQEFTVEKWRKCCEHVYKVEEEYWKKDAIIDQTIDSFIISVNNESSDSEECSGSEKNDSESDCVDSDNECTSVLPFEQY